MLRFLICYCIFAGICMGEVSPQTGGFKLTLTETSPMSSTDMLKERVGFGAEDYDIASEYFDVYVPKSYDGTAAYGLIAFISSSPSARLAGYWPVLDRHKVIWIGGHDIDNERAVPIRVAVTLDGVYGISKRYRIDKERIYVVGDSGGGRCASRVSTTFPDVFAGGAMYFCGCNGHNFPGGPDAKNLAILAKQHRYAFLTGSKDFNQGGTKAVFEGYKAAGFTQVEYFEQEGMGHEHPPADLVEKGLTFLDSPLMAKAEQILAQAEAVDAKGKNREAYDLYSQVASSALTASVAAKAAPRLAELTALIDADGAKDLDKIMEKPNAAALKAFVAKWRDFPISQRAILEADKLAAAELEPILADKGQAQVAKLRKFRTAWDGYPSSSRALEALDERAKVAWQPVSELVAGNKRQKAIVSFVKNWKETPTADEARTTLEGELDAELGLIRAIDKPATRAQKLQQFSKAWPGTDAAQAAERELGEMMTKAEAEAKAKQGDK
jgi:hypothetical protein